MQWFDVSSSKWPFLFFRSPACIQILHTKGNEGVGIPMHKALLLTDWWPQEEVPQGTLLAQKVWNIVMPHEMYFQIAFLKCDFDFTRPPATWKSGKNPKPYCAASISLPKIQVKKSCRLLKPHQSFPTAFLFFFLLRIVHSSLKKFPSLESEFEQRIYIDAFILLFLALVH